jgi:hypothetical protein
VVPLLLALGATGGGVIRWLIRWWHKRQRAIDVEILWPACRDQAATLDAARAAFTMHAFHDPAWQELGSAEIHRRVRQLS